AAGASATTTAAAPTGGTLTINAIEMLSGSGAFYGKAVQSGLELAVDKLNSSGGVLGKKVALAVADNNSDNAQTSTLVKKFADDSSVGIIIPPTYQPNFNAACSAATSAGLPIVSAQSGPPDPAGNTKDLCFTMTTDPVPQVTFTLKALQAKGLKSFAMVYDQDNGYVQFQKPNIEAAAKAVGITIQEIGVPGGTTDFGPQITQLINDKPESTFAFFTIEDASRFIKQAKDNGYTGSWFDPVSQLTSRRIPDLSGGAATGMLASTPQSADDIATFKTFLADYKAKTGSDLDDPTYTGFGYDAMMMVAKAITDAGTSTDRTKIQAAIAATSKACFSICFTQAPAGPTGGAFLADQFFLVSLSADGFVAAK
ncbi:MAG: Extracellular ligand-binding receptor, partial [Ilumatobacteraceae bacterium]|nr:Extracellular ligand-binding receptor [Ilumatobacteraceae bacterium]